MKQINYTLTEDILQPYGITIDDLANANGYQTQIIDPATLADPENVTTIANPNTPLQHIALLLPKIGAQKMIENAMAPKIRAKEVELVELRAQPAIIAEAIVAAITKTVTE